MKSRKNERKSCLTFNKMEKVELELDLRYNWLSMEAKRALLLNKTSVSQISLSS